MANGLYLGEEMRNVISIPGWMKVIYNIHEANISDIAKKADIQYTHVFNIIAELKKQKIVTVEKKGRVNIVKLTNLGYDIYKSIVNIERCFL